MNYTDIVIKINGTLDNGNDKDIAACNGRMNRFICFFFIYLSCVRFISIHFHQFVVVAGYFFSCWCRSVPLFRYGALYALAF